MGVVVGDGEVVATMMASVVILRLSVVDGVVFVFFLLLLRRLMFGGDVADGDDDGVARGVGEVGGVVVGGAVVVDACIDVVDVPRGVIEVIGIGVVGGGVAYYDGVDDAVVVDGDVCWWRCCC